MQSEEPFVPTEPGFYWCRVPKLETTWTICQVYEWITLKDQLFMIGIPGNFETHYPLDDAIKTHEFALGPLTPPEGEQEK